MMDKNKNNPLEELYTDVGGQINPSDLLLILKPFLRIHRETSTVIYTPTGMGLPANKKIILLLLAKKALYLLGAIPSEFMAPKEIKIEFGKNIPSGTIDGTLNRLSENGPVKSQGGKYFIPDFNFSQVQELFKKIIE